MEALSGLGGGFDVALHPENLLYVTIGVLIGTVVGLLPGLGATAAIAVLLPVTYHMDPASGVIMLAGIYYGAMYGGRIPSILLNIPGDASSVITALDGHPLAKQGRAGSALGLTGIGSFIGGTVAIVALTLFAPIVAQYATRIGAPEMFFLALGGLLMVAFIGSKSRVKSLVTAGIGLILGVVGIDAISGTTRLTFGSTDLSAGISIVPLAVGLFGIGEILYNVEKGMNPKFTSKSMGNIFPSWQELKYSRGAIGRASVIGTGIGLVPGGGGALSSVIAYSVEKKFSKHPEKFGKGAVDGLAATETADNASSNAAFIPMLTLGLPPNPVLAVIFGALLLQNISPGPQLISQHPDIFWGVIASMYIGNVILLMMNLPLIKVFVQILRVPPSIMFPLIILIAFAGVYSANNSLFDVGLAAGFGVLGYILKKTGFELAPLILAFILGPIMEVAFARSMLMSSGSIEIFFGRPGSLAIVAVIALVVVLTTISSYRQHKRVRDASNV